MTDRRFTDKPHLDPSAVTSLPPTHLALRENRTLFPSTVVNVDDDFTDRLLVSGDNSRKLGKTIVKGKFKGYSLYSLTLEERATCSPVCDARSYCYGNTMHYARRHRITDQVLFYMTLEDEIREILLDPAAGLMVRLHVLGDFPSIHYVDMWSALLNDHERLAVFGYTHWSATSGKPIFDAIESVKHRFPERFRIRWSRPYACVDSASVIDIVPTARSVPEGIVCPAQTDATACCASCALCWDTKQSIAFIKHGRKSEAVVAQAATEKTPVSIAGTRTIVPLKLPSKPEPGVIVGSAPEMRMVFPTELLIEPAYQRDLSAKSVSLIRKIVAGWEWAKFKPPVCAETKQGLFIIDGQHTAIAAASHPSVTKIPVMIVGAEVIEARAGAFVAHNRDRLTMSPFELLNAEVTAGGSEASEIVAIIKRNGGSVPRSMSQKGKAKPGEVACVSAMREIYRGAGNGPEILSRVVKIAVMASCAPVTTTVAKSLRMIVTEDYFAETAKLDDRVIADALHSLKDFEQIAQARASETGASRYRAGAVLIAEKAAG